MKGYSLHVGVNVADPLHYPGLNPLKAAVNDAKWWESYAKKKGYAAVSLHDADATITAVKSKLSEYAKKMEPGDILLLTYSGHGGEMPNEKPDDVDTEKMDQTWCLYDEQLLDDELFEAFREFKEGTRIVVVADSCHSGTITRAAENDLTKLLEEGMSNAKKALELQSRQLPKAVQRSVMDANYDQKYEPKLNKYKSTRKRKGVKAAVKLLAACQDHQVTYDGRHYGIFTEALSKLLTGKKMGTAQDLIAGVRKYYGYPKPNFFEYGAIIPSFDESLPFEINIENAARISGDRKPVLTSSSQTEKGQDISDGDIDRNAVLVLDIEGKPLTNLAGGREIEILENKTTENGQQLTLEMKGIPYRQGWGAAHALQTRLKKDGVRVVVEPVLSFNPDQLSGRSRASSGSTDYIPDWPPANASPAVKIGWHLDDAHSQLATAAKRVMDKAGTHVTIGHLDTGYLPDHVGLPEFLQTDKARSFVSGEDTNQAIDKPESGMDGHGMGTIGLLAGNKVPFSATFNEFEGFIGGAPMAKVIPIRISNSVIIWNSDNFCDAVDYALEQGCEVITMSMAGKPSRKMAKAVNRAYEQGLVIVSAASNCWYDGIMRASPKCVLWPAAFERVIAATGAMYNNEPYDADFLLQSRMDFTKYMQGSWGPASRMKKALAAYTPNTPWASEGNIFARSGGGTSSATPQIAAAASLWIAYHRDEMVAKGFYEDGNKWQIVEAVRSALFQSAAKGNAFPEWHKYYGNGILRANDALNVSVSDVGPLTKSEKAESSFWGFFQIAGSFFANRPIFREAGVIGPDDEALAWELLHLQQVDPAFFETFSNADLNDPAEIEAILNDPDFSKKVIESQYASDFLKQAVSGR